MQLAIEGRRRVERFLPAWVSAHARFVDVFQHVAADFGERFARPNDVREAGVVGDIDVLGLAGHRRAGADAVGAAVVAVVSVEPLAVDALSVRRIDDRQTAAHADKIDQALHVERRSDHEVPPALGHIDILAVGRPQRLAFDARAISWWKLNGDESHRLVFAATLAGSVDDAMIDDGRQHR